MTDIPCLPLKQLTDGPLFGTAHGTLSALTNMELRPGGYAEARGGFSELMPSGGTAADAITTGGYSAVHQSNSSGGWMRTYDPTLGAGSQYSSNKAFNQGGWQILPGDAVDSACYFGSYLPFSRVGLSIAFVATYAALTMVYEYWNGSTWTALTTSETFNFTAVATTYASWNLPTDWATTTVGDSGKGNVLAYWMRARVSAETTFSVSPAAFYGFGYWVGYRDLYEVSVSPSASPVNGTLKRHGQTGTTEEWFSVNSALFSGSSAPTRCATYRGVLYFLNGKDFKRWDGENLSDVGLTQFAGTAALSAVAGGSLTAGYYRYYVSLGYGKSKTPSAVTGTILSTTPNLDQQALYGIGRAFYCGEQQTTGGNLTVRITFGGNVPNDAGSLNIYRTQDLTNVEAKNRSLMPAFRIGSFSRVAATSTLTVTCFTGSNQDDTGVENGFPPMEAITYSNLPPSGCKYIGVYQNRMVIGDDETWYWSDPFQPDSYFTATNYIALSKWSGSRNMGCVEFADQMVLFTENQVWGLTNIDLDIPQLYPIALDVGCVAPESISVGDGLVMWLGGDGFYAWAGGKEPPYKVSGRMEQTFGKMSFAAHGGSRATIHNRRYDVRLADPRYTSLGSAYRFSFDTGNWATLSLAGFASTLFPLTTIRAPLGNSDAGANPPVWGKVDYGTGAGEYGLFLGELTTQDAGTNYSCSATMHYPLRPGEMFTPERVLAYYQATDGWGTPSFTFAVADNMGSGVGTLNTGTPDTGTDYSMIAGTFSAVGRGSSDLQVTFTVPSAASGTVNRQRLFGSILTGKPSKIRRGGV